MTQLPDGVNVIASGEFKIFGSVMSEKQVRDYDKFMLRLPEGMRESLSERAKKNGRSMNSEIVEMLSSVISFGSQIDDLPWELIKALEAEDFSTLSEAEKRDREETLIDFAGMLTKRVQLVNGDLAEIISLLAKIRNVTPSSQK